MSRAENKVGVSGIGSIGTEAVNQLLSGDLNINLGACTSRRPATSYIERLRWGSTHPERPIKEVFADESTINIDGEEIPFQQYSYTFDNNGKLNSLNGLTIWKDTETSIILEATGVIKTKEEAWQQIEQAGAFAVVIPSPGKGDIQSISYGLNHVEIDLSNPVFATESCTSNCAVFPINTLMLEKFKIQSVFGVTTHTRTESNSLIDSTQSHGDPRRSRAATVNIIPTSTGANKGILRLLPELSRNNVSVMLSSNRVPVDEVSRLDMFINVDDTRGISTEKLHDIFIEYSKTVYAGVMGIAPENSVSLMFSGSTLRSILDLQETYVYPGGFRVSAWYPNVAGPTRGALDLISYIASKL